MAAFNHSKSKTSPSYMNLSPKEEAVSHQVTYNLLSGFFANTCTWGSPLGGAAGGALFMQVGCKRNDGSVNSFGYNLGMCRCNLARDTMSLTSPLGSNLLFILTPVTAATETIYNDNGQLKCFGYPS